MTTTWAIVAAACDADPFDEFSPPKLVPADAIAVAGGSATQELRMS